MPSKSLHLLLFAYLVFLRVAGVTLETEATLRAKVVDNPTDPNTHLNLMQWHLKWGELSKAMEALKAAITSDPERAWQYQERLGDLQWKYARDQHAAEARYRSALEANPEAKRSLLHYGMLQVWRGRREEADRLFQTAVESGLLRDVRQRPLEELDRTLPASGGPWPFEAEVPSAWSSALTRLREAIPTIRQEFLKWNRTRPQDADVDKEGLGDPHGTGRWLHYWVYHPRFERGTWNGACHYKTPKICEMLKELNGTGAGGLQILRADLEVLEAGASIRPHCHTSNAELFIDICLQAPRVGASFVHAPSAQPGETEEQRSWSTGEIRVLDPSFEHGERNKGKLGGDAGQVGVDYREELRLFYSEQGNLAEKEKELDHILEKWSGREEKMIRELRKKYLGDRGERVLLRLLVRHPNTKLSKRAKATGGGSVSGRGVSQSRAVEL
eukprot:TRINITY_DN47653_c0_g1_i1.p1 TRINITY_DN47653_c0_g1~~TRINITY_DN47653_c0_g1_i1.p1  ORF type:complete len:443 (+),score=79.44 TRINITY_DN47653_c0_g1_i1:56-1384(+)